MKSGFPPPPGSEAPRDNFFSHPSSSLTKNGPTKLEVLRGIVTKKMYPIALMSGSCKMISGVTI